MKSILIILSGIVIFVACILALLFFFQEKLIFFPDKLASTYTFRFQQPFEEFNIKTKDGILLHAILFKADKPKGVIFYLHGNAGSLDSWGEVATTYTDLQYDVFMPDYRGYGKSEGNISGEAQIYSDLQIAFDTLKGKYAEKDIVVLGYSIGAGPAAKIASTNAPRLLILQAPYYSLVDMTRRTYPFVPVFLLKYKFETYNYLQGCGMPVVIFHGTADEVIYYGSSLKLKAVMKASDRLIPLAGEGHNGMSSNTSYLAELRKLL